MKQSTVSQIQAEWHKGILCCGRIMMLVPAGALPQNRICEGNGYQPRGGVGMGTQADRVTGQETVLANEPYTVTVAEEDSTFLTWLEEPGKLCCHC